ncbi:MAG: efflux transporter outer membrane subunit [Muribaculaceae bacterium]|nr:efflux transporter outer membrane subunit [Muribaculaceae bacterium]
MKFKIFCAGVLLAAVLPSAAQETANKWWSKFGDSVLDSLVTEGLEANYDVAAAVHRVEMARAAVGQARAAYYPTIGVSAGWSRTGISGVASRGEQSNASWTSAFAGQATMSWEPDIFGRITSQVKARKAGVRVSRAEFEGVQLSVASEIASAYASLRMSQRLYQVALEHTESQEHVLDMVLSRYEAGLASKLEVAQAKTVYYSTKAQIPLLLSDIDSYKNALGVLLGCGPEGLPSGVGTPGPMLPYRQVVPSTVPMNLLRNRPDVAQAEAQVESDAAALGVAKKEYLPSLTIEGSVGTGAHRAGDLFTKRSFTYSIAPTLSWTVFEGLGRKFATESARQQMEADIALYKRSLLTAAEEADNSLSSYRRSVEYIQTLDEVIEQCREAMRLSVDLYKEGLTPFSNVVDAQMNYLTYQSTAVQARGRAASDIISLHKALGGNLSE